MRRDGLISLFRQYGIYYYKYMTAIVNSQEEIAAYSKIQEIERIIYLEFSKLENKVAELESLVNHDR